MKTLTAIFKIKLKSLFLLILALVLGATLVHADWWAAQKGALSSELTPATEYSRNNSAAQIEVSETDLNHVPTSTTPNPSISIPEGNFSTNINFSDADSDQTVICDLLEYTPGLFPQNLNIQTGELTGLSELTPGQTGQIVIRIRDVKLSAPTVPISAGVIIILQVEGKP